MATWHSASTAAQQWPDIATMGADQATELLEVAKQQVLAYAPTLAVPDAAEIPDSYRLAQVMQARALWQAQRAAPGGELGGDGFGVRVYPMDWQVKALLRPPAGYPGIA